MTDELKQLVATLSQEANDAATEALVVAGSNALRGTGMLTRLDGEEGASVRLPRAFWSSVLLVSRCPNLTTTSSGLATIHTLHIPHLPSLLLSNPA